LGHGARKWQSACPWCCSRRQRCAKALFRPCAILPAPPGAGTTPSGRHWVWRRRSDRRSSPFRRQVASASGACACARLSPGSPQAQALHAHTGHEARCLCTSKVRELGPNPNAVQCHNCRRGHVRTWHVPGSSSLAAPKSTPEACAGCRRWGAAASAEARRAAASQRVECNLTRIPRRRSVGSAYSLRRLSNEQRYTGQCPHPSLQQDHWLRFVQCKKLHLPPRSP